MFDNLPLGCKPQACGVVYITGSSLNISLTEINSRLNLN